jgi:hypothetical protein
MESGRDTCGQVAITSASHAEGRQSARASTREAARLPPLAGLLDGFGGSPACIESIGCEWQWETTLRNNDQLWGPKTVLENSSTNQHGWKIRCAPGKILGAGRISWAKSKPSMHVYTHARRGASFRRPLARRLRARPGRRGGGSWLRCRELFGTALLPAATL